MPGKKKTIMFRLNARNFFLTYSNVEQQGWHAFTNQELFEFLTALSGTTYVCVGQEQHEDGSPHFHAIVTFKSKKDLRNESFFNFGNCHPNIQPVHNYRAAISYCKKDGHWTETPKTQEPERDLLQLAMQSAEAEYFQTCYTKGVPYGYATHFWKLGRGIGQEHTICDNSPEAAIIQESCRIPIDFTETPSVLFVGSSGIGKTSHARNILPKPFLLVRHLDTLKHLTCEHKGILFDDLDFRHLPLSTQINLCDYDLPSTIHIRYGTAVIPAKTPRVFTCNDNPFHLHPAIERRLNKHFI